MTNRFIESLSLEGVIESVNSDLYSLRRQMTKGNLHGLGPPDLVILTKKTENPDCPMVKSCHYVSGLTISSPSSFAAYFASLTNLIPKTMLGSPKYSLIEGCCYTWDAFSNVDIQITVKNPGSCNITALSEKQVYNISELTWRELTICTTLRFWRASEPLFAMLFGYTPISIPACRLLTPEHLSCDDIRFVVTALPPSNELDVAIANALIASKERAKSMTFLRELATISPRILTIILKYIPVGSPTYPELSSNIYAAYSKFPDDINLACACVDIYLERNEVNKCLNFVPLLLASMWRDPEACIALARINIAQDRADDAIFFLNAACYSREPAWMSPVINLPVYQTTKSKKFAKSDVSPQEQLLCASHFCGPAFNFYRCLSELASDVGIIKLQTMMKYKSFTAKTVIPKNPELDVFAENPPQSVSHDDFDLRDENLYDPGISSSAVPPALLSTLPTSAKLISAAEIVFKDIQLCDSLKRSPQFPTSLDAVRLALSGIRVGDMEAVEVALKYIKGVSPFADLLRMRMLCETQWTSLSSLFHEPPKGSTLNEVNATTFAKTLSIGLESFVI